VGGVKHPPRRNLEWNLVPERARFVVIEIVEDQSLILDDVEVVAGNRRVRGLDRVLRRPMRIL
jgi:hypothetical protein